MGQHVARDLAQHTDRDVDRDAFFWQIVDGRLPAPPCAETLGIDFTQVRAVDGTVEVGFEARPEFRNPAGTVQGGFLAAMLDDTAGQALAATLAAGEYAPTANLNVAFVRAARVGPLVGRGRVVRRGTGICFLSAELLQGGELVATATATAVIRRFEPPVAAVPP